MADADFIASAAAAFNFVTYTPNNFCPEIRKFFIRNLRGFAEGLVNGFICDEFVDFCNARDEETVLESVCLFDCVDVMK